MRISINFASREYLFLRKVYALLALLVLVSLALFSYNLNEYSGASGREAAVQHKIQVREKDLADLKKKLADLKTASAASEVKDASKQALFANQVIAKRAFSWTTFMNRMEEVVPDGIAVMSISPDFVTLDVNISGQAADMATFAEFFDRITKSRYFEDLPPSFHTNEMTVDKETGKTMQQFNIRTKYIPEGRKEKNP